MAIKRGFAKTLLGLASYIQSNKSSFGKNLSANLVHLVVRYIYSIGIPGHLTSLRETWLNKLTIV